MRSEGIGWAVEALAGEARDRCAGTRVAGRRNRARVGWHGDQPAASGRGRASLTETQNASVPWGSPAFRVTLLRYGTYLLT
jgi:hypothetical protein